MQKAVLGFCIIAAQAATCLANEDRHLEPEDSVFSEFDYLANQDEALKRYDENVLTVFQSSFDANVFARVIVFPSFENEYAISLKMEDNKYFVELLRPKIMIWPFTLKEVRGGNGTSEADDFGQFPDELSDITLEKCRYSVPNDSGEQLFSLWGEMLFRTRYPDQRPVTPVGKGNLNFGLDGTTYHFSFEYGFQRLAGKIWSPEPSSETGQLVEIVNLLRKVCEEKNQQSLDEIQGRSVELLERLKKSDY